MTHTKYASLQVLSTPCTASHLTYGGRCLNCGYDPATQEKKK